MRNKRLKLKLVSSLAVLAAEQTLMLKVSVMLPPVGMQIREKFLVEKTASQVRFPSGKKKTFKRFRQDLHQVVVEGKRTDDLKYVMETDDNSHLFACYLVSIFGHYTQGQKSNDHHMAGNKEVMDL